MPAAPGPDPAVLAAAWRLVSAALRPPGQPALVLGICGSQGSGKSTLAAALARESERAGIPVALLSLDDLYLSRAERAAKAAACHPLFRTRGVPGTHDAALGIAVLDALVAGQPVALPRFDKATDDPVPRDRWPAAPAGSRLVILEGWCIGAVAEPAAALADPVNALERDEDAQGLWRRAVNAHLATDYPALFGRIDRLILLAAPSFDVVLGWRIEQEQALRRARGGGGMDDATLTRFVQHYERLTRHILREMPARADLTIRLDERRRAVAAG